MESRSPAELVADAKTRIREVRVGEVKQLRDRGDAITLIDVREPMEWNLGRIPGAVHIPLAALESQVERVAERDGQVVIYCARGNRSALAADALQKLGYENVSSMAGGWLAWAQEVGEVED